MRDFGDKRSTTWNQAPKAVDAGLAPGRRTLVEMLPQPASELESTAANTQVQRKVTSSGPVPAMPSDARPTIHDLFGRVQRKAAVAEPDTAAVHTSAQEGIATAASPLPYRERIQQLFGRHDISGIKAHSGPEAAASAGSMGAKAYATGEHVVLGQGADLHTIAHEAAHVVQQRGGVQLKGGVGQEGDAYEQHADEVANLVVQGKSAEAALDRFAGGSRAGSGSGDVTQRRMGAEAEVKMPVTGADGEKLEGDFKLIEHENFTLVTDHRKGYSNLEFVMKPFDQLAGSGEEAVADLKNRLSAMKAVHDDIYKTQQRRAITNLDGYGAALQNPHKQEDFPDEHARAATAVIDPTVAAYHKKGAKEDHKIMVHYTIGFPVAKLYDVMSWVEEGGYDTDESEAPFHYQPKKHAASARAAADAVATRVNQVGAGLNEREVAELKGAVALLYSQVAAFVEACGDVEDEGNKGSQIKNRVPLLSRVNLSEVQSSLSCNVKKVFDWGAYPNTKYREIIVDELKSTLNQAGLEYRGADTRQVDSLTSIKLDTYVQSALGGGNTVNQQRVFGGMNVVGIDEQGEGGTKVPVELRRMHGRYRSWAEFVLDAEGMLLKSRVLIDARPVRSAEPARSRGGGKEKPASNRRKARNAARSNTPGMADPQKPTSRRGRKPRRGAREN